MKLWFGYGSEHSSNLVMIGRFKDLNDASKTKEIIERLTKQVQAEEQAGLIKIGERPDRYTDDMLNLLQEVKVYSIAAAELEQFAYDFTIKIEKNEVVLATEEIDVSAFLKVLIDKGARIEVYSAHDYPDTEHGRGK